MRLEKFERNVFVQSQIFRDRIVDVALFILAQNSHPTRAEWLSAVDDLIEGLDEEERGRLADAGIAMLMRARTQPGGLLSRPT